MIRAALIDLDGTLLDTAGDLAAAANRMLAALALPRRTIAEVATYVGKGIPRLVERCLTGDLEIRADPRLMSRALPVFSSAYDEESGRHTRIYAGVVEGLEELAGEGVLLGCVTNKAERFTLPLLERMQLAHRFRVIVSGDTVARGKPDPLPYLHACERLGVGPGDAIVIGDSENDVVAARAAGIRVLCVTYGYTEGRPVESLGADAIIPDLRGAAAYVRQIRSRGPYFGDRK
jgi:phosphoglycolate phosphatase